MTTNRRDFIKATSASLAMCSAAPFSATSAGAEDETGHAIGKHIYKSLKWGMIRTNGTTLEKFKLLKELGYDGVELDSPAGVDKREALRASQTVGLPIEGIVNSTHWTTRLSDRDPAIRMQALDNMRTALRDARYVGADSVLLVPGKVTDPKTENHDQVWKRSMDVIRKLLPMAEELKVKILIENVGNGFCSDPRQFAQYIDEINSPWVGVHFDIGNHIWAGPPAEWIRVLGRRIRKLDIKDRTKGRERTKVGEGVADWPSVRSALTEIGYRGWAAAEVSGGERDRLAEILARMNRVVGKSDGKPRKELPGATRDP